MGKLNTKTDASYRWRDLRLAQDAYLNVTLMQLREAVELKEYVEGALAKLPYCKKLANFKN